MSNDLAGKRVLLGQAYFERFAGSEMVTLELAEYFASRGAEVAIATRTAGEPLLSELDHQAMIRVFDWESEELDVLLRSSETHLSWIHHHVIPPAILEGAVRAPVVFAHLSAMHPLEFPLLDSVEEELAAAVVFTTDRARQTMQAAGALSALETSSIGIFANPAPEDFFAAPSPRAPGPPWRIGLVSNHPPAELLSALDSLGEEFVVTRIGRQEGDDASVVRVTPQVIDAHHALVTIGKTVQYSLVRGRAVFCYDHFGGPGWLTSANVTEASLRNFSGAGSNKGTAQELADSIRSGIESAVGFAESYQTVARGKYSLDSRVREIESAAWANFKALAAPVTSASQHIRLQRLVTRLSKDWSSATRRAINSSMSLKTLKLHLTQTQEKLHQGRAHLEEQNHTLKLQLTQAQEELRQNLAHLAEQEEISRRQLADSRRELQVARGELSESLEEARRLSQSLASLRAQANAESKAAADDLHRLEAEIIAMRSTVSWKMTSPIRHARKLFSRR